MPNSPKTWAEAQRLALKQARKTTAAEEARIEAGIEADPDTFELDDKWFAKAKPARGRPRVPAEERKVPVTMRLDPDVLGRYKATGRGYQTRMADDLRKAAQKLVARGLSEGRLAAKGSVRASAKKSAAKGSTRSSAKESAGSGQSTPAAAKRSTRSSTGRRTSKK
jgi:uncharacterized protein (DUF4415 family)